MKAVKSEVLLVEESKVEVRSVEAVKSKGSTEDSKATVKLDSVVSKVVSVEVLHQVVHLVE